MQWRLQSPKQKQLTPELVAPPGNDRDTPHNTARERRAPPSSPSSQLAEFRPEGGVSSGDVSGGGVSGGGKRNRKVTPIPPPTRGGRHWRRGGGGGGELEAIPEVASSHSLHETTFL